MILWFRKVTLLILIPVAIFSAVPRYSLFEVCDINNRSYKNPFDFDEIKYKVTFESPKGQRYRILGFFDGSSTGNQVWRARIAPMDLGTWHYFAQFSDGAQAGEGIFEVIPSALHGPIVRDPGHPCKFMHHDGTPIFILGNTAYNLIGCPQWQWELILSNQLKLCTQVGFNKIRFVPYSEEDYKDNPVGWNAHPWLIRPDGTIDYTRYNLAHWRKIEKMVQRFGQQGVIADFIFVMHELHVDDGLGGPYSKQRKQYYQYAVARLQGYWNIAWDLENEANEAHARRNREDWRNYDVNWYDTFAKLIVSHDAYLQHEAPGFGRMVGVHDSNTPPDFAWANHSKLQWKTTVPQGLLFRIDPLIHPSYRGQRYKKDISRDGKPVVYEEYGYEGELMTEYLSRNLQDLSQEIIKDNKIINAAKRKMVPGWPHRRGDKGDRQRRAVWTITTCGAYATYGDKTNLFDENGGQINPGPYGRPYVSGDIRGSTEIGMRYLAVLASFIRQRITVARFQTMLPHHELITKTQIADSDQTVWQRQPWYNYPEPPEPPYPMAFCLADPGENYLVYLPYGGWVEIDLAKANQQTFQVIWLDPKTGEEMSGNQQFVDGGQRVRFSPPSIIVPKNDPGDWVLYLKNSKWD